MTAIAVEAAASETAPATGAFSPFEWMVAFRYLRARNAQRSISVIAGFSFLGIVLGVAALIVVMSVMNGFRHELMDKMIGLNGHMFLQGVETPLTDYDAVAARTGRNPVVIDSDDLVAHPEQTVQAYCEQVGIEFRPDALRWTSGLRTDWAKTSRWHESTSRTTGFAAIPTSYTETVRTNPVLAGYLDYHQPFYERLHANRLAVGSPVTIAD